ncbi:Secreted protein hcp [Providencia rettgeri]|nr:Secreted protein hcp [Providencia rettgeri]
MSYLIYLSLQGDKQGLISTGCSSKDSIGNRYQLGHENEIQVIGLNHSMTRTQTPPIIQFKY